MPEPCMFIWLIAFSLQFELEKFQEEFYKIAEIIAIELKFLTFLSNSINFEQKTEFYQFFMMQFNLRSLRLK